MPNYRRKYIGSGTYFFTVKTYKGQKLFSESAALGCLRASMAAVKAKWPFEIQAMVVLPEHLPCIWTLPPELPDYSSRWGQIKRNFTKMWLSQSKVNIQVSSSRQKRKEQGFWQRRFWEHAIRDRDDFARHMDYIHFNPVKHKHVDCPHQWPYSSFHRWVKDGAYACDWLCNCGENERVEPDFGEVDGHAGE